MAYNTISELFKGICDALRNKTGVTGLINHQDIPSRIDEIVISNGGVDTSDANATEEDMVEGKSAYVDGQKITGNIPIWTSINWQTPTASWDETNKRLQLKSKITARRFLEKESPSTMYCSGDKLGTATPADVRKNTTFTSADGLCISGEWEPATNDGGGVDTTISTNGAESNDIINGKRAWVNDTLVVGNMTQLSNGNGFNNCTPSIKSEKLYLDSPDFTNRRWIEAGDHIFLSTSASNLGDADPSQVLKDVTFTSSKGLKQKGTYVPNTNTEIDGNLIAENIKTGVSINGITGTFTNDATATASDIAKNKTAYVKGGMVTGNLEVEISGQAKVTNDYHFYKYNDYLNITINATRDILIRQGGGLGAQISYSEFGDAEASDVTKGKIFTSSAGFKEVGTKEETTTSPSLPEGAIAIQKVTGAETSTQIGSGYSLSVTYGDDVIIGDSIALEFSGTTSTLSNISSTTDFSKLQGKYVRVGSGYGTSTSTFYYIPSGSTFTVGGSSMSKTLTCDRAQTVSLQKINL